MAEQSARMRRRIMELLQGDAALMSADANAEEQLEGEREEATEMVRRQQILENAKVKQGFRSQKELEKGKAYGEFMNTLVTDLSEATGLVIDQQTATDLISQLADLKAYITEVSKQGIIGEDKARVILDNLSRVDPNKAFVNGSVRLTNNLRKQIENDLKTMRRDILKTSRKLTETSLIPARMERGRQVVQRQVIPQQVRGLRAAMRNIARVESSGEEDYSTDGFESSTAQEVPTDMETTDYEDDSFEEEEVQLPSLTDTLRLVPQTGRIRIEVPEEFVQYAMTLGAVPLEDEEDEEDEVDMAAVAEAAAERDMGLLYPADPEGQVLNPSAAYYQQRVDPSQVDGMIRTNNTREQILEELLAGPLRPSRIRSSQSSRLGRGRPKKKKYVVLEIPRNKFVAWLKKGHSILMKQQKSKGGKHGKGKRKFKKFLKGAKKVVHGVAKGVGTIGHLIPDPTIQGIATGANVVSKLTGGKNKAIYGVENDPHIGTTKVAEPSAEVAPIVNSVPSMGGKKEKYGVENKQHIGTEKVAKPSAEISPIENSVPSLGGGMSIQKEIRKLINSFDRKLIKILKD